MYQQRTTAMKNYTRNEIQKMIDSISKEFSSKIELVKLSKSQKEMIEMIKRGEFISLRRRRTLEQLVKLGLVKYNSLGKVNLV